MNKPVRLGLAAFAAACLASPEEAFALDLPRPLTGHQVKAVLLGKTLIDIDGTVSMYYPTADTIWGLSGSGDVDVGRWWIENDSYCRSWRRWFDAEIRCWQLALGGNDSIFWYSLDGKLTGRSLVRPGNAIGEGTSVGASSPQLAEAASNSGSAPDAGASRAVTGPDSEVGFGRKDRSGHSDNKPPGALAGQTSGRRHVAGWGESQSSEAAPLARAAIGFNEIGIAFTFGFEPVPEDSLSRETTAPAEPAPAAVSAEPASLDDSVAEVIGRERFNGSEFESAKNRGEADAGVKDGGSDRD